MSGYFAPLDAMTTALLDLLRTSGRDVYDGAYGGDPLAPAYPYHVLYRIAGGSADPIPTLDLDLRVMTVAYQVTTVAQVRNQCENAALALRELLLARTATGWANDLPLADGWQVVHRAPDPAMPGVDRTGDYPAVLYNQPARYLLTIAPTA